MATINPYISFNGNCEEAKRFFVALSSGGSVNMPLEKTFWGALFGMLTDRFGVQWMVNFDYNQGQ